MRDHVRRRKASATHSQGRQTVTQEKGRLSTLVICLVLVALVWAIFGQTLGHDFVNYDDDDYIHRNPMITHGLSPEGIQWAFTHVHSNNWHPLTSISHMLDCQVYGLNAWGHHLTNILLHAAASVLLFLALSELTGVRWASAFVAAIFAVHPLHVESVAWVAERKDVLSALFFMLILWMYPQYARSNRPASGRYILMLLLFALGLTSKPTLVTLPFVLLLLDYWPLRRFGLESSSKYAQSGLKNLVIEKIPFFALSFASCIATLLAQQKAVVAIQQLTFGGRVGNAIVSYIVYVGQMLWPFRLSVIYPYRPGYPSLAQIILACLILVAISLVCFAYRRRFPFLIVGWLWFLGVLVPMIGIVQVGTQVRADRYTYLSQIGLYILITWGTLALLQKWRSGRAAAIVLALLTIAGLTAVSYGQVATWQNSETMWHQALTNTSNNYVAENNLGNALMKIGRPDEAVVHFRKALEINPDYLDAKYHLAFALGYVLASQGNKEEAIASFQEAIRVQPANPQAHHNLAVILAGLGRTDEAVEQFREALRLDPDYAEAHRNFATVLLKLGQRDEGMRHLREALRIKPEDASVKQQLLEAEQGN